MKRSSSSESRPRASRRGPARARSVKTRAAAPPARKATRRAEGAPAFPLLAGAVVCLLALWMPLSPLVDPKPTRLWRGYETLLVRAGGRADERLPAVISRLGPGVVSEYTTTVDFYDFSSQVRLPYTDLARRLDQLDPRRDPYMDGMMGYFSVTSGEAEYHVLYVPARSTAGRLFCVLLDLLGPPGRSAWRLVDFDPIEKVLSLMAPLAFVLLVTLGAGRRRRGSLALSAVGAVLWLPSVLAGGPSELALCLLLLFFWLPLLRARLASPGRSPAELRKAKQPFLLYVGAGTASIVFFCLLNGRTAAALLQAIAPFFCSLLLVFLVPFFTAVADGRRRSRVFASVPVIRTGRDPGKGRQGALSLALFVIAITMLEPLARGGAFPAPIPVPRARSLSWDAVERLRQRSRMDRLPDFSDLVAHEAYQQTLGYGRKWKQPVRNERIYRHEYLVDPVSGVVQARLLTVKVFDSEWLASVGANPAPSSLEALLMSQGRPVAAAVRGAARAVAMDLPFSALAFCALLALLAKDLRLGLLIRDNLWRLNREARRDQV